MGIAPVELADLPEIRSMIEAAIRQRVVPSEQDVQGLVVLIDEILRDWELEGSNSVHLKYLLEGRIVGVALVKNFCKLSTLFVAPEHQRQGIGRALIDAAICECKPRSSQPVLSIRHVRGDSVHRNRAHTR